MMIFVIIVALLLAWLVFRFIAGMVKWVLIGGVVVVALILAHQSGAF